MKGRIGNQEHGKHGWFQHGERSYAPLLKSEAVQLLAKSYSVSNRASKLYQFQHFLEINQMGSEEILSLPEEEIKKCIRRAVLTKNEEGHYVAGRNLFYVARRFLELNGREVHFNRTEKKVLLKRKPKKIAKQHIPSREEIYRMADAMPNKGARQHARGNAITLCLWQSGVRASCLCSWLYGMFKDKLWSQPKIPVPIKVVAYRPPGVFDCAQDTKLSSYNVNYYYTFLHEEAAWALRTYLDERIADGWKPKDSDPVFVTEGTASQGEPVDSSHLLGIVKSAAQQIGIDPETIWTHCLRKAFRKTLYRGGVDPDVAEALMGHKLPASRGSYFDYHDVSFAANEYMRGFWNRIDIDRIRNLEDQIGELQKEKKKREELENELTTLKERMNNLTAKQKPVDEAMEHLLEDPEVQRMMLNKLKKLVKQT